ncbi:unnamed protein product [Thelazia callipaeda]|uniref:DNA-directed RNA polymerase III subunit RPC5 n=1 Tax=Thelazia callipaeda TaxID=103827 RepID=A0A0N5CWE4_THECL|nr:unnamed protein product [Thelazia callipaeda]
MKGESEDSMNEVNNKSNVTSEIDVILCRKPSNTELYRVQYPIRKVNPFGSNLIKARYKKNVKILETRLPVDKSSTSFDSRRAEHLATIVGADVGTSTAGNLCVTDEEVYVGRSFENDAPTHYAIGFFKNQCLYLCPLNGTFDMKRSISYLNSRGQNQGGKTSDDDISDSGEEMGSSKPSSPIRVRYKRPETERQKKRREQSSAHRSLLIEQDPWISLNISCETNFQSIKFSESSSYTPVTGPECSVLDPEQLVEEAIIREKMDALDLSNCNQLISLRRIRHLPEVQQVRALILKARCISTNEAQRYVSKTIPRHLLISRMRDCAHLVCNIWVLKTEFIYSDEGTVTFQYARDLVLCLFNSNLPVRRCDIKHAFGLSEFDIHCILKTLNRVTIDEQKRSWKLLCNDVEYFGKSKEDLKVLIEEKRYWHKRWEEIHQYLMARKDGLGNLKKKSAVRQNISTGRMTGQKLNDKASMVVID